jgi:hypothetical protein
MKVIQTQTEIGADRELRLKVPDDIPAGTVNVLIVLEPAERPIDLEARRKAVHAATGILRDRLPPVDDFLAERRDDQRRRDEALGFDR